MTFRILSQEEAMVSTRGRRRSTMEVSPSGRVRTKPSGRPDHFAALRGVIIEPWKRSRYTSIAKTVARIIGDGGNVYNQQRNGFRAFWEGSWYDFLMLGDFVYHRVQMAADGIPGPRKFRCDACGYWTDPSDLELCDVGEDLASVQRLSVCRGCTSDGVVRRTIAVGYVARLVVGNKG